MQYTKGSIGRVFIAKFENNDVILDELTKLAKKEKINAATFVFIGALREGHLVTGPKKPIIPPDPHWEKFGNAWEVLGVGTLFANKKGPQIHVHSAMGQKAKTLTGCVRKDTKVFLVIEAFIFEIKGAKATKDIDPKTGLNMLKILGQRGS